MSRRQGRRQGSFRRMSGNGQLSRQQRGRRESHSRRLLESPEMTGFLRALGGRWRSLLTIQLLSGTLLLVSLLTLQAQYAWTYHRTTAEGVLRDYSRLVAEEFIRRASLEI